MMEEGIYGKDRQEETYKALLTFSIPLLIGNIFQQFYNMADTIML